MELQVEGLYFSSAHRLMHHPGKCSNVHGHTFHTKFIFYGQSPDEDTGMMVDFADVKNIVSECVDSLDHCLILNVDDKKFVDFIRSQENRLVIMGNEPTVEEIAKFLFQKVEGQIDNEKKTSGKIVLTSVQIWETPKFSAIYGLEDSGRN